MNSRWLQNYEEKAKEELEKLYSPSNTKKGLIIGGVICLIPLCIALYVGATSDYDPIPAVLFILVLAAMIFLVLLTKSKTTPDRDVTKKLREHLAELLQTPDQVEEFDAEVMAEPLVTFDIGTPQKERIFFTNHYICSAFHNPTGAPNMHDYRFARLEDIKEMRFAVSRDQSKVKGLGRLYSIDLLDANRKKRMGLVIPGKKKILEFEEHLKEYCPGIKLQDHGLLS